MHRIHSRSVLTISLAAVLLLAACSSAAPGTLPPPTPGLRTPTSAGISTTGIMPCKVLHVPATPAAALEASFEGHAHISGPADAPVTIVVFSDYQCAACAILAQSLKQVRQNHAGDVKIVYLNAPVSGNDKDALAVQAVEAADLQGKYWEMHDLLFEKQVMWLAFAPADFESWLIQQAASLGLDPARFKADFEGKTVADRLQEAEQSMAKQPLKPPVMFVNGTIPYNGLADYASLDTVIRMDLLATRQYSACPHWIIDPFKQYVATLHTSKGDVVIQLYPDKAPLAVNNFVFLAEQGWYDGVTFHRVIPNIIAQTGDPSGTGMGNPGYLFSTEIPSGLLFNQPGQVAMDNSGANTNGSQFFINLAPNAQLDGQYTIFGQVLSGMGVLSSLSPRDPKPAVSLPPGDVITSITIEQH
ncbi:MAG TPA: peptidylprolyl isomerase [Anaerolineales bacterium]|nr:peptidylprolyl isomerase [Anaerolineales bacterium]